MYYDRGIEIGRKPYLSKRGKEKWIINCISKHDSAFIWEIDKRLKLVFPYFKKELEFQLGYNDDKGEFFFFHFGNKNLMKDSDELKKMMPQSICDHWTFISEK
jgi:hypothetical protein